MDFQIQESRYCSMHRVMWTWQHIAVISHSDTQRNTSRWYPALGDAYEELLAALRGLLHLKSEMFFSRPFSAEYWRQKRPSKILPVWIIIFYATLSGTTVPELIYITSMSKTIISLADTFFLGLGLRKRH